MKIVHVFKDYYPPLAAGITRYIADISDGMAERGHDVDVHVAGVRHSRRDRMPSGAVIHRHREITRALSMPIAPGLVTEIRNLDADVIHVHLPNPIGELGAVLNTHTPSVCTFHAQLGRQRALEPLYKPLRTRLFNRTKRILVSGETMAQVPELAGHREKVQVLPFGVSPQIAKATTTVKPDRGRESNGTLRLLFVGRLVYYKGVDVLLRAMTSTSDTTLRIVGEGPDRERLESLSVELGTDQRIQFLGSLPDAELRGELNNADVFVLPSVSRAEAFGLAMAEAMSYGLPAISTALGTGTDWVNLDGVSGIVVPPGDVAELAGAIERLGDQNLRDRLSTGARQRALETFSFDHHLDALEAVYRKAGSP